MINIQYNALKIALTNAHIINDAAHELEDKTYQLVFANSMKQQDKVDEIVAWINDHRTESDLYFTGITDFHDIPTIAFMSDDDKIFNDPSKCLYLKVAFSDKMQAHIIVHIGRLTSMDESPISFNDGIYTVDLAYTKTNGTDSPSFLPNIPSHLMQLIYYK